MATEDLSDNGSCEKLLNDSEKSSPHEDVEDDCIQLLLNALEKDGADAGENLAEGRETDTGVKVYLKQKYGKLTDRLDGSVNGSVSELNTSVLKLNTPTYNTSTSGAGNAASKRAVPSAVLQRQKLAMKLLKKHRSETGKIMCGIVIILIILGIGGSLMFLAFMLDMEDLYIIGGIFSLGGIIFTIAFIVVRCQTSEQLEDTDYSVLYKTRI